MKNKVTVLMGPGACGKTHEAAWIHLCEYWCLGRDMVVLVSSTDMRGLELRVWGQIKTLFEEGKKQFPWLIGNLVESKHAICTDDLEEDQVRDLRRGIIAIPCVQNGKFVGLGKYVGIHQKYVRLVADEAQFMGGSFLNAFANLNKNESFRAVVLGNPNDPLDPLGKAAEPADGWSGHLEPEKTTVWDTRFMGGRCVNLVGTDSPNFDYPQDQPPRFPYLISGKLIRETLSFFQKDSAEYYSQCVGVMKIGTLAKRVIDRDICRQFRAQEDVVWKGTPLTRICALDAAYGGDRCVCGHIEFGEDITGHTIFSVKPPFIIPIRIATNEGPEDQIARKVMDYCEINRIPPENFFHDATGRGSLGTALARLWSAQTNPVEFGGVPTNRPVCLDLFIRDARTNERRLMLCNEHYLNFVTELWYSLRYCIEASQMRNLPDDVMEELCMRKWEKVSFRIQVEPKTGTPGKPGMKERTGRSPDLGDWLAIALEGARRRGFGIAKLANDESDSASLEWLDELRRRQHRLRESHTLNYRT